MSRFLSRRILDQQQSAIRKYSAWVQRIGGVNLSQGVCDQPAPDALKQAAKQAIDDDKSMYTHMQGIHSVREAIAEKLKKFNHITADPETEIAVTIGSAGAFASLCEATLDPGDNVVTFSPYYSYHTNFIKLLGNETRFVEMQPPQWQFDRDELSRAVDGNTKMLLVCTPSNPTGKVFDREELEFIIDLAAKHDCLIVTDEGLIRALFNGGSSSTQHAETKTTQPGNQLALNQPNKTSPASKTTASKSAANASKSAKPSIPRKTGGAFPPFEDRKPPLDAGEGAGGKSAKQAKIIGKEPPVKLPDAKTPGTAKVAAKKPTKQSIPPKNAGKRKPKIIAGPAPLIKYVSPVRHGLLFRHSAKHKDWFVVQSQGVVKPNDRIASPEPFDATLDVGSGRCRVTLLPGTSVRSLPPSAAAKFGFEILHGRVIIRCDSEPKPEEVEGATLELQVRGEVWRIDLLTRKTVCGITIRPNASNGFEVSLGKETYTGELFAASGSVRVANPNQKGDVIVVTGRGKECGRLSLSPGDRSKVSVTQSAMPSWLTPAGRVPGEQTRRDGLLYIKEFEIGDPGPAGTVRISMLDNVTAIVKDRRARVSEFAVRTLAVTESYADLVRSLDRAQHEDARKAAFDGLRKWLPAAPGNGKLLKAAL
ncbi:MAG: aminotransferase class I/II-fold pyridoxal phosphate-dependent enzyme, partial [Planctomycetes bacterium]|nr:aminotransferase class I/II-fold pyridoxal phosphate-dependent enzyme [Planctomycetota bacterium]